jgi:hypothetical protein
VVERAHELGADHNTGVRVVAAPATEAVVDVEVGEDTHNLRRRDLRVAELVHQLAFRYSLRLVDCGFSWYLLCSTLASDIASE